MANYMKEALKVAKEALVGGEVPVGCLFIYKGQVIATGSNTVNETRNATRHAEMDCVEIIVKKYPNWTDVLHDCQVVVTVEPCIMCAAALHDVRVASITYGCANDRFGGCSSVLDTSKMYTNPCPVVGGVMADEAMDLLKEFYKGQNPNAPECKVKLKKPKL
ncbi:tRNA-specific adenosine deaminase 2-like isoform X2 [Macrosteles quadrilineatus]|uniref:tRNA-specific adenosine deaminase 2-like isoform X2 n=1 Tax=Macrosteles quadrilineatus TaxID=74068 RepID=UPI0023E1CAB1|nr:tRNA-specific adenosine deaminase 2-like isoform X2 [Macrosteles quadrilineatus]